MGGANKNVDENKRCLIESRRNYRKRGGAKQ